MAMRRPDVWRNSAATRRPGRMTDFRQSGTGARATLATVTAVAIDVELAHRIAASSDTRYDERFVVGSVLSRIYCRPSCSATAPLRKNTRFFASAADAQAAGYRPCKRCQPDATLQTARWSRRADVAIRALRLIGDGLVDREGVGGLASRLGYSQRQLHRILLGELGATPIALARAHRAQSARMLVDSTDLPLAQVAVAAGFGSIRQFNDTMRELHGMSPSQLRSRRSATVPASAIRLKLACREPFDGVALVRFLKRHEVPGLERVTGNSFTRALALERGHGVVTLTPQPASVLCELRLQDFHDLVAAVARCRRLFDLDADPIAIQAQLSDRPVIGELVCANPGVRIPGTVDGFELAIRTIIRERNTPERARETTAALVRRHGRPLGIDGIDVTHTFPTAEALAVADPATFGVDPFRARAIHALSAKVAAGELRLDAGAELDESIAKLLGLPGIGPWIASYIAMRALGDPDAFLYGCARVERALQRLGVDPTTANVATLGQQWRPWRSYALAQLWRLLDDEDETG
jgi:AraC family transcriptional regulator of adaptative response / DNA-3-methyladenine glycosylase II